MYKKMLIECIIRENFSTIEQTIVPMIHSSTPTVTELVKSTNFRFEDIRRSLQILLQHDIVERFAKLYEINDDEEEEEDNNIPILTHEIEESGDGNNTVTTTQPQQQQKRRDDNEDHVKFIDSKFRINISSLFFRILFPSALEIVKNTKFIRTNSNTSQQIITRFFTDGKMKRNYLIKSIIQNIRNQKRQARKNKKSSMMVDEEEEEEDESESDDEEEDDSGYENEIKHIFLKMIQIGIFVSSNPQKQRTIDFKTEQQSHTLMIDEDEEESQQRQQQQQQQQERIYDFENTIWKINVSYFVNEFKKQEVLKFLRNKFGPLGSLLASLFFKYGFYKYLDISSSTDNNKPVPKKQVLHSISLEFLKLMNIIVHNHQEEEQEQIEIKNIMNMIQIFQKNGFIEESSISTTGHNTNNTNNEEEEILQIISFEFNVHKILSTLKLDVFTNLVFQHHYPLSFRSRKISSSNSKYLQIGKSIILYFLDHQQIESKRLMNEVCLIRSNGVEELVFSEWLIWLEKYQVLKIQNVLVMGRKGKKVKKKMKIVSSSRSNFFFFFFQYFLDSELFQSHVYKSVLDLRSKNRNLSLQKQTEQQQQQQKEKSKRRMMVDEDEEVEGEGDVQISVQPKKIEVEMDEEKKEMERMEKKKIVYESLVECCKILMFFDEIV